MERAGSGDRPVLSMVGDIDIASEQDWRRRGSEWLDAHPDLVDVVVDMAGVSFLDSRGMSVLVDLHTKALGARRQADAARRAAAGGEGAQCRRPGPGIPGRISLNRRLTRLNQDVSCRENQVLRKAGQESRKLGTISPHSASSASAAGGGGSSR